jgi:AhpD family alkylhydroperoxidase
MKYLISAGKVASDSGLPAATQQPVEIRASQINGCAVCTDMQTKDAAHAVKPRCASTWSRPGGRLRSSTRPNGPPWNWPSRAPASPTRAGGGDDEAWANAAKHYDEEQLAALVALIAGINAWNRMNVITRQTAGDYQPGQWG